MKLKISKFRPIILSRHPSHSILRAVNKTLPLFNFRTIIRFGSSTATENYSNVKVEINTVNAIKNSANKLRMKKCFTEAGVQTADWWVYKQHDPIGMTFVSGKDEVAIQNNNELPYPIVAKHIYGSRGTGNTLLNNEQELQQWLQGKTLSNYIFEKFYNYSREYRLHVTKHGCFYTCRKMIKTDTPDDKRWFRNDQNSVWVLEQNELFDRPVNWKSIEEHCVKALNAVGLDVGAVDLRVQSATHKDGSLRKDPEFIVIEINSAPSFGEVTSQKYIEILPKLINEKYNA
jgi:glutathione synthase/RimK-type ligase-like ATP-grasp enzyme